jgi:tetratricopeptide (TPR) repeat protein
LETRNPKVPRDAAAAGSAPARQRNKSKTILAWSAGVAVPITVALIGLLGRGSGDKPIVLPGTNNTFITSISMIENQYQQVTGQPLKDGALKQKIQEGINLTKAGQFEASRKVFEEVAQTVPVAAVFNNLGALYAQAGQPAAAHEQYQKAVAQNPDFAPARDGLKELATTPADANRSVKDRESEPNNDPARANLLPLESAVAAAISEGSDLDYFRITAPNAPRDVLWVALKNTSDTLRPQIDFYDGSKKDYPGGTSSDTAGADLEAFLTDAPGAVFYIRVSSRGDSAGTYTLLVKPLRRFDSYEPNDTILQASPIALGKTIDANIMDGNDVDYYQVKSSSGTLSVHLKNNSGTLEPQMTIFDSTKNEIDGANQYRDTPGAELDTMAKVKANETCYVKVWNRGGTAGPYSLTVK